MKPYAMFLKGSLDGSYVRSHADLVLMTPPVSALIAACHSAACRPPTSGGTGGSSPEGGAHVPSPNPKPRTPGQHPKASKNVFDFTGKDAKRGQEVLDAAGEKWRKSLSEEETAALRSYTSSGYVKMNKALRSGKPDSPGIQAARAALERTTIPVDIIVKRGMLSDNRLMTLKVGQAFHDAGFQSTSVNAGFAGSMQMRILVPKGSKGVYMGKGRHSWKGHTEGEVLLPPGGTYRVLGHTVVDGIPTLDVELISQGNPPPAKVRV